MLARSLRHPPRCVVARSGQTGHQRFRTYATHFKPAPTSASMEPSTAALKTLNTDFDKLAPRFDISASQIQIIETPLDFYSTLKDKILHAKRSVFLSTLYIGKEETDFIDTIRQALRRNPQLRVSILTDYLRGTRENPQRSCATLLAELYKEYPKRVEIYMYHTPNLNGLKKQWLPARINEGWGLQHMKLYGFDDEIMLSGANLSDDYFTNRQDRYHLISSGEVTQYFRRIYNAVCKLSYGMALKGDQGDEAHLRWDTNNPTPNPITHSEKYIQAATKELAPLVRPFKRSHNPDADTHIYPLFQFSPIMRPDRSTELVAMKLLLGRLATPGFAGSSWTFTAGYFNMTPEIRDRLLASNPVQGTVIAASPWANGFYGSKGVSGMLPAAYTHMAKQFLTAVSRLKLSSHIKLKEWRFGTVNEPGGWTYHAKGLWITLPKERDPSITLIGSSNYTKRSYSLDLEANALITTTNPELKKRLGQEQAWLQKNASEVTRTDFERTERRVGLHVRIAMWIVTLVGGAL
ncbi:CDP-diacylglycerol--glycerol-3-phosphate 3-phosphatidyltransferase-like protein [Elsinoe fawcettii]|nr:CDP-diacylglycerol--glycerol-3-phosphate 3-phosphatidyltransferase-like protein [Elsinoe fawcettii]